MHLSGKILIPLSVVILLAGGGMIWSASSTIEDARTNWAIEGSSGEVELHDEDGKGELGFAVFIPGEYVDADGDGQWDACEDLEVNVTAADGTGENKYTSYCDHGLNNTERHPYRDYEDLGMILAGVACGMEDDVRCEDGTYTVEANRDVNVIYSDRAIGEVIGAGITWIVGACSACFGGFLLILGLILGFALRPQMQATIAQQKSEFQQY